MLSYNEVAEAIENEGRRIGQLAEEIADVARNAAEMEADYKIAYAASRIATRDEAAGSYKKVTVDMVDDEATIATADHLRSHLIAKESLTAAREAMRAAQARLDGLRTLAAGYRQAGG